MSPVQVNGRLWYMGRRSFWLIPHHEPEVELVTQTMKFTTVTLKSMDWTAHDLI